MLNIINVNYVCIESFILCHLCELVLNKAFYDFGFIVVLDIM